MSIPPEERPKAPEKRFPWSTQDGTTAGWSVEARVPDKHPPLVLTDHESGSQRALTEKWSRIDLPSGKPLPKNMDRILRQVGLFDYASAQAFRWTIHADCGPYSIETRLVKHLVKYSISVEHVGDYEMIDAQSADRPA